MSLLSGKGLCLSLGFYVDEATTFLALGEHHCAVNKRIEGVILAHAHVDAGMVHGTALTFDDVACLGVLTAKNLHSESFAL